VVRGFDADIVVVLESWRAPDGRGLLDDLERDGYHIETLQFGTFEHHLVEPELAMPGEGDWELAFCSRFPIVETRTMPIGSIGGDRASPRSVLVCTVEIGGTPVEFVALHTSSKLWKLAPVRHLRALAPQLPPPDRTAVVVGDFNWWGPGVVAILRPWRRAVRGRTYPAHRPHSQIDHVLVRDDITVVSGEVLGETPSDHRPVRARLRVKNRPAHGSDGALG
jgi:endonuclease/exonuclease/phosphatase family metal-dependent hydrolase